MKPKRSYSLKWILTRRLIALQAVLLTLFLGLFAIWVWIIDPELEDTNESIVRAVAESAARKADGALEVNSTPELAGLQRDYPALWFTVRDQQGRTFRYGSVGDDLFSASSSSVVTMATLKFSNGVHAAYSNRETPIGRLEVIASTDSIVEPNDGLKIWVNIDVDLAEGTSKGVFWLNIVPVTGIILFSGILPILVVLSAATLIATPRSIGRSLAGLVETAAEAKAIEFAAGPAKLDVAGVPSEVVPLVEAFNEALGKLESGYQRHNRFLADAAHELRTPIAIVRTRAELLPSTEISRDLLNDVDRLSHLANQLLDFQALGEMNEEVREVDLNELAGKIAVDLAPIAIDNGYDFAFEPARADCRLVIRAYGLELALTNLVRNAIDHGGRSGVIVLRVRSPNCIEVCDQGPGIPAAERGRVTEPFYRLNDQSPGAGLGLNLAKKAAELHGGALSFIDEGGYFIVRMTLYSLHEKSPRNEREAEA